MAAFSCYHIEQRETVSLNSAYLWTVLDRSARIIYFIKFSQRKWWKWVRWFPLRVRMKELGKNAASICIHYLFSQMLSSSWMENCSSLLRRSRPNRWSKFPWCSAYLVLAFISFDKDLLVWRFQGGYFTSRFWFSYFGTLPETAAEGNIASVHCVPSPR